LNYIIIGELRFHVMKKMTATLILLIMSTVSWSQDTSPVQPQMVQPHSEQDTSREKIRIRNLPRPVQESLKAPDYAGWTIDDAYEALVTDSERPETVGFRIYIVELKRREEKAVIKFDKGGNRLDQNDQK
jgi:hypothetical protein